MSDTGTPGEATAADTAAGNTTPEQQPAVEAPPTFTQADINRLIAKERKDTEARLKAAAEEESTKAKGEFEKLYNTEKSQREAVLLELRQERTQSAVHRAAVAANLANPDDAWAFIGSKIEYDDDGKPIGIEEAVKALIKERPYLVKQEVAAGNGASAANPAGIAAPPSMPMIPGWSAAFGRNKDR